MMSGQGRGGMIKQGRSSWAPLIVRLSGNGQDNALQAAGSFNDQQGVAHATAGYAKDATQRCGQQLDVVAVSLTMVKVMQQKNSGKKRG
ncbi:hypothetical protein D1605_011075 [Xylella fastidiosa subsp. fastidiosa]|jgi:hypothetical protein|uniref:Uncharacterized protein n=1 Tax=Xylella fastidiosa (strain M23) TaxID=405441 RepID=B2IAM6_XYLF2|nr:hypothetical protein [Xylella fastidiosa]ACB93576.1 hypothetical protein XfasM23_2181 [Xylella fastidiosa M23]KGM19509.1 hypothetical protein JT24_11590 [Xylella fastidiosa]MBE0261478.1 hypothetical protein [Xylella fastidiosa subsp. fastidiosa]MBE0263695.1 hypothetical protein [Xylella fastidiosa subsp. fastidiosa]MBE0265638.1 hypothetical protein [Xylella fastidiosa subsp. fastidiosa]